MKASISTHFLHSESDGASIQVRNNGFTEASLQSVAIHGAIMELSFEVGDELIDIRIASSSARRLAGELRDAIHASLIAAEAA